MKPQTDRITQSVINTALNTNKDTVLLKRTYNEDSTTSSMTGYKNGNRVLSQYAIELPWRENQRRISCIPEGVYDCELHTSPSKGKCYSVKNVKDRDNILIHVGNYVYGDKIDLLGCIAPALDFADINKDGHIDGVSSGKALQEMFDKLPDKFKLIVYS